MHVQTAGVKVKVFDIITMATEVTHLVIVDPVWLSVNLGILICLQCSGVHRNLSVQVSRIRSLDLEDLQTFELLIALSMSNQLFNEVMEANLTDQKPTDKTASDRTSAVHS